MARIKSNSRAGRWYIWTVPKVNSPSWQRALYFIVSCPTQSYFRSSVLGIRASPRSHFKPWWKRFPTRSGETICFMAGVGHVSIDTKETELDCTLGLMLPITARYITARLQTISYFKGLTIPSLVRLHMWEVIDTTVLWGSPFSTQPLSISQRVSNASLWRYIGCAISLTGLKHETFSYSHNQPFTIIFCADLKSWIS